MADGRRRDEYNRHADVMVTLNNGFAGKAIKNPKHSKFTPFKDPPKKMTAAELARWQQQKEAYFEGLVANAR